MSNRIKKQESAKNSFAENTALIMGIFTFAVLCVLPLVFRDFYFNILETKYQFYCACVIGAFAVMTGYGLCSGQIENYFKNTKLSQLVKRLNFVDWAMLAFWLCNVISCLLCFDWRIEAFWGTSGRFNGLFLMTLYMVIYFLMTRFFHFRQWYLDAFLAVGLFVSIFGITDYFQMDIFNFKVDMVEGERSIYTSTLGNINTYTIYVGAAMVISMILFALEQNRKRMLWYYGNLIVSTFSLIMGTSDNAYLTLAALFGLSPLLLFRTKTGLRRYLISLSTFATVIQCIDWINAAYSETVLGIDSAFRLISNFSGLPVIIIALWLFTALIVFLTLRGGADPDGEGESLGKWLIYIWIAVIAAVVGLVCFVFYDANIAGNADRYGAISSYVVFNDAWGTERGYVWRRCMEIYLNKFTILQKIFGYGPDTFRLLMQYYYEATKVGDRIIVYDSVHNEYLHYLVTLGITGLVSYLLFIGSAIVRLIRNLKGRPEMAAVLFAFIAYVIQAVVNINIPIATPIILTILMMGLSRTGMRAEQNEVLQTGKE